MRGFILAFMAWLYLGFNLCFLTDIQWVPEDRVTLFTSDGLVQIGGSLVPRRITPSEVPNHSTWARFINRSFFSNKLCGILEYLDIQVGKQSLLHHRQ